MERDKLRRFQHEHTERDNHQADHLLGRQNDTLPITISVYQHSWDEPYISTELNTEPIFSGTAYEYIEKFGCDGYTEKE